MTRRILRLAIVLAALMPASARAAPVLSYPKPTRLPPVRVRAGAPAVILLDISLPEGWTLDTAMPLRWRFSEVWAGFTFTRRKQSLLAPKLPLRIPFTAAAGDTGARLEVNYSYCRRSEAKACRSGTADYVVVLESRQRERRIEVPVTIKPAQP